MEEDPLQAEAASGFVTGDSSEVGWAEEGEKGTRVSSELLQSCDAEWFGLAISPSPPPTSLLNLTSAASPPALHTKSSLQLFAEFSHRQSASHLSGLGVHALLLLAALAWQRHGRVRPASHRRQRMQRMPLGCHPAG